MSLNFREIDLVLKELDLAGSRIDKINQPDRFSLFIGTYSGKQKQNILINLDHGTVRINRIAQKPLFPDFPPRFSQLLRARIKGGKILAVSQPHGERLVHLSVSCRGEKFNIWIRLWSGNSNILLTDESNRIIDVYFRKPKQKEIQGELFIPDFSKVREKSAEERPVRDYSQAVDFNSYIESEYGESNLIRNFEKEKEKILKSLKKEIDKTSSRISKLETRKLRFSHWEELKETGELIRANLYRLKKGDSSAELDHYSGNNSTVIVLLKPELSPQQNCDLYFTRYKKYRQGYSICESDIEIQKDILSELDKKYLTISNCLNFQQLSVFSISKNDKKAKKQTAGPGLIFQSSGFIIRVGRNSKENDQLLRKQARGNDIWLHVRDFPGGFVFIKTLKGKSVPLETLLDGANLALLYSSKKNKDKADIHYTEVKNLRRLKGGKEGLVLAQNEKNLYIKYDIKRIGRLQNKSNLETFNRNTDN